MSDFPAKRFLLAISLLSFAATAFAAHPSARYETRMAYDAAGHRGILFGGLTANDTGTKQPYYLGDTWQWNGSKWSQIFTLHSPAGRSAPVMVYDSIRNHVVLFGGFNASGNLNDTWYFNGSDWIQINTPNAPPGRYLSSGAYDSARDKIVIFGGTQTTTVNSVATSTTIYDTWEFDGTTWRQIGGTGPTVAKPLLVYDEARNQVLMLGIDASANTLMYAYDPAAGTWTQLKPATLPACVNEGILLYDTANAKPFFTSGICSTTATDTETLEWDGTTWKALTVVLNSARVFGAAAMFDSGHGDVIQFGGTPPGGSPWATTYVFAFDAGFIAVGDTAVPGPRSLFTFTTDPARSRIWLFGGIDETTQFDELWQFQNGIWSQITTTDTTNTPTGCLSPVAAYDTDRSVLVIVCGTSALHEWDGTAWKKFDTLKTAPGARRFSSATYDQTLKKTVMFGGFDGTNYLDETWTWDGTLWARVKSNPAPSRELASMWFDPTLKKTVIYGGLGRLTTTDRITRYDDMWSFDGKGWTQLKPVSGTPGMRYGALTAVDPRTNHTLIFGGLRVGNGAVVPPATIPPQIQVYADDTWEWDGTAWTKKTTNVNPPARENGGLAYDPTLNTMVMFAGYAGHFLSDMWTLTGNTWSVRADSTGGRRRAVSNH